jgi:hypothetical protein
MKRLLTLSATTAVFLGAALTVAAPAADAWPSQVQTTLAHNPTGARYTAGTGWVRAWQYCETNNGQTDFYQDGPWVGINTWSWTGSCANYRGHGFDIQP